MRYIFGLILTALLFSCKNDIKTKPQNSNQLKPGTYRGWIPIQDNEEIPFIFKVESDKTIEIYNADEIIVVDEVLRPERIIFLISHAYLVVVFQ